MIASTSKVILKVVVSCYSPTNCSDEIEAVEFDSMLQNVISIIACYKMYYVNCRSIISSSSLEI